MNNASYKKAKWFQIQALQDGGFDGPDVPHNLKQFMRETDWSDSAYIYSNDLDEDSFRVAEIDGMMVISVREWDDFSAGIELIVTTNMGTRKTEVFEWKS